jgi:hypothetical protein
MKTVKVSQVQIRAFMKAKLSTSYPWAKRALIRLYTECQTSEEQNSGATYYRNGYGFNGTDDKILSSFANQITIRQRELSEKQVQVLFKLIPKYWAQIWSMITPEKKEEILIQINNDKS